MPSIRATPIGKNREEKRYHQSPALYQIIPISAALQTGVSPPTRITNPSIITEIRMIRIQGRNERRKSERKIISIITFDPLTTMICMSHEAFKFSLNSGLRFVFCPRIIPERISCHIGGKISESFLSNQRRIRTKILYDSGGVFSIWKVRNSAIMPRYQSCFSDM